MDAQVNTSDIAYEEKISKHKSESALRENNDTVLLLLEGTTCIKLTADKTHLYEQGSYFKAMENFREGGQAEIVLKLPLGLESSTEQHEASSKCTCILCRLFLHKEAHTESSLPTSTALQLVQAADYFGFAEVIASTVKMLQARLETDCFQIQGALDIPELESLKKRAKQVSLCLFVPLGIYALSKRSSVDNPFLECSAATLRELMVEPRLNCTSESALRAILQHWSTLTQVVDKDQVVEELVDRWKSAARHLPLFPCVMGQRRAKRGELKRRGTEGGGACRRGEAALLVFNPLTGEWRGGMDIGDDSCLDSTGFKATSVECEDFVCKNGELCDSRIRFGQVVISGGEHHLGHSQWSRDIWLIDTLRSCHKKIGDGVLERGRRHHAAVLACCKLYLIGGYGRHRDPLASVEVFDLASKQVRSCASLPYAARRPAATLWMGQLVVVAEGDGEGGLIFGYMEDKDLWERIAGPVLPQGIDRCVAGADGSLFLTSTFSRVITMVSRDTSEYKVKSMGTFSREAGNVCMVGSKLYNFYSEEFGDERVVESFDTKSGIFSVHLKEELAQWDFSPAPQYSYGCFPILAYSL